MVLFKIFYYFCCAVIIYFLILIFSIMSEKSKQNWSFFFKVLSYVATAIAGFFTGTV